MDIFERLKEKKIVWGYNKTILLNFFFKKKNLERNFRSIFLFFFYKTKISESFFWNNNYKLSKFFFQNFFVRSDLRYLNVYFQILLDYFDRINLKLFAVYSRFQPKLFLEIKAKKNFKLIMKKKSQSFFIKGLRFFLRQLEIGHFREGNFLFRIN
jgi:hypothetical protein